MNIGIIILAAGNSSRLGRPKQLLAYQGDTLLQHTLKAAQATSFAPIVLVLGAYAEEILAEHAETNVNLIINHSWEQGISSSIAAGIAKLMELAPETTGAIIAVADQPHISASVFEALAETHTTTGKNIIASSYSETIGTPVLFSQKYFDELLALQGDTGAKPILRQRAEDLATVPFDLGHIDIDTTADYHHLTHHQP